MKRFLPVLALLSLLAACLSSGPRAAVPEERFFEGTAPGWRAPVRVALRLENGAVAEIRILEHGDDPYVGGAAMEELLDQVLFYNTTDLDAVSGATESSTAFLAAVEEALQQAGRPGSTD